MRWAFWKSKKNGHNDLEGEDGTPPDPATETIHHLTHLLSSIEPNTAEAETRLLDAQIATETLTRQVLKVVDRVEDLERQANYLNQAVEAIRGGKRDEIAYIAGKIEDDSLRAVLLSPFLATRDDFKAEAFVLLGNERGSLEESAAGYMRLVTALIGQLAQARARIIGLEQSLSMLEAAHPVLKIEISLKESIGALNLRAEPALRWSAKRALPPSVQGYLN